MDTHKKRIVENLKNWYAIDSILLNDHARNKIASGKAFKEWVSVKASLLSTLNEYYVHINFEPTSNDKYASDIALQEAAVSVAKMGKSLSAKMILKEDFKTSIKEYITEQVRTQDIKDIRKFSDRVIRERFLRMSLDNILIGLPILESKQPTRAKDFKGQILEESYRMMRNALIHMSKTVAMAAPKKKSTNSN